MAIIWRLRRASCFFVEGLGCGGWANVLLLPSTGGKSDIYIYIYKDSIDIPGIEIY